jgi:pimeloyl-ACP methyl ester carboxylesterase
MRFNNIEIEGLDIFYREAGKPGAPKLVLLHGYPSSHTSTAT